MTFIEWFRKLVTPVEKIGVRPTIKKAQVNPESVFPIIASVQSVLANVDVDDIASDPVLRRALIAVYHESMEDLLTTMYTGKKPDGDNRKYAVSLEKFFSERGSVSQQMDRLLTALEAYPEPGLRVRHDIETIVHVLTVTGKPVTFTE